MQFLLKNLVFVCGFFLLMTHAAQATVIIPQKIETIALKSQDILYVKVVNKNMVHKGEQKSIYTQVEFAVHQSIKGKHPTNEVMMLTFEGGQLKNERFEVAGMPQFNIEEEYIIFPSNNDSSICPIVGWSQGVFHVKEVNGGKYVYDDTDRSILEINDGAIVTGNTTNDTVSLEEFLATISLLTKIPNKTMNIKKEPSLDPIVISPPAELAKVSTLSHDTIKWHKTLVPIVLHQEVFRVGDEFYENIVNAMESWNNIVGSNFQYQYQRGLCDVNHPNDNVNCVSFVDGGIGDAYAVTKYRLGYWFDPVHWEDSWKIEEVGIFYDMNQNWVGRISDEEAETNPRQFLDEINFYSVSLEQFGQGMVYGSQFGNQNQSVLNEERSIYRLGKYRLWGYDHAFARNTYPDEGNEESNLSISNWKTIDNFGFCPVETIHRVRPYSFGEIINVEFTLDNTGTTTYLWTPAPIMFYLSKDNKITTDDIPVSFIALPAFAGSSLTYTMPVKLRMDLKDIVEPGIYYIGAIVDVFDNIEESNETDNAMAIYSAIEITDKFIPVTGYSQVQ